MGPDLLGISETEQSDPVSDSSCPPPRWNDAEGRCETGLMWKSDDRPVSNLDTAAVRTRRMTERLGEDEFSLDDGHTMDMPEGAVIEKCDDPSRDSCDRVPGLASDQSPHHDVLEEEKRACFLPHGRVFGGDKIRLVCDGSARDDMGKGLNDYLQASGHLLKLPAVLLNLLLILILIGMFWSTSRDELAVVGSDLQSPGSKRKLPSVLSRVFDPPGIHSSIRSTPDLIASDNAKTCHSPLSHIPCSVTWRFVPEAAPWWEGFWKRWYIWHLPRIDDGWRRNWTTTWMAERVAGAVEAGDRRPDDPGPACRDHRFWTTPSLAGLCRHQEGRR